MTKTTKSTAILSLLLALLFAMPFLAGAQTSTSNSESSSSQTVTSTSSSGDGSEAVDMEALMAQVQVLMKQVEDLQKQLEAKNGQTTQNGQNNGVIKDGLVKGTTDQDVTKIQELLATDSSIYPEGLVTGYFGSLTENALKRFQSKHGLASSGEIDPKTKTALSEYLKEAKTGQVPAGLLNNPGLSQKVMEKLQNLTPRRFQVDCNSVVGTNPFCSTASSTTSSSTSNSNSKLGDLFSDGVINRLLDRGDDLVGELEDAIEDNGGTDADLEDALEKVKEMLEDAEGELAGGDNQEAKEQALEAIKTAKEALRGDINNSGLEKFTVQKMIQKVRENADIVVDALEDTGDGSIDKEAAKQALDEAFEMLEESDIDLDINDFSSANESAEEANDLINDILKDLGQ